jgi:23S rRNA (adenine2503-C2)-methyltransferase
MGNEHAVGELAAIDLFGFTRAGLEEEARARIRSGGAGIAGRLFCALYSKGEYEPESYGLKDENSALWRSNFYPGWLESVSVLDEQGEDGLTRKALLKASDGLCVECVLIPMGGGRSTLCVSSQIGCRMGCAFCQTGKMGLKRDLSQGEIVAQIMTARFRLKWDFRNIVFMGMGEPLDNAENVIRALRVLTDQSGLHFDAERITVCTSGPPGGIERLAEAGFKRLGLSISLNGSSDAVRGRLMPVNDSNPLETLRASLAAYPQRRNFVLGVNYCLVPGMNDAPQDAAALADFCSGAGRALVNVIPYNPGDLALSRAPTEEETERFIAILREKGTAVRRRATKGRSIMAACGQLGARIVARP